MSAKLTKGDISVILESFGYSKDRIRNGQDSTYEIRDEAIKRIEEVERKLRAIRDDITED